MTTEDGSTHEADARFEELEERLARLRADLGLPPAVATSGDAPAARRRARTTSPVEAPDDAPIPAPEVAEPLPVEPDVAAPSVAEPAAEEGTTAPIGLDVTGVDARPPAHAPIDLRARLVAVGSRASAASRVGSASVASLAARARAVRLPSSLAERGAVRALRGIGRERAARAVAIVVVAVVLAAPATVLVASFVTGGQPDVVRSDQASTTVRTGDVLVTVPVVAGGLEAGMAVRATTGRGPVVGRIVDIGTVGGRDVALFVGTGAPLVVVAPGDVEAEVRAIIVVVGWPIVWLTRLPRDATAWVALAALVGTVGAAIRVLRPPQAGWASRRAHIIESARGAWTRGTTFEEDRED